MALTPEQIAEFKALGYILVPNLVDPSTLDNWRAQIRAKFGDLSNPLQQNAVGPRQQHREDITILRGFRFSPKETQLVNQPKVKAIVDHMGDGQICGEDGNLRLLLPEPEWHLPERGHIDGYLGKKRGMPFLLGLATYIYDVEPRGGGTIFWPRSHIKSWEFLRKHPDHLNHSFKDHPEYLDMIKNIQPVELHAKAGDIIFWHCNILHATSQNTSNNIRYGLFARLPHKDQETFRDEIPDDLWKRWRI